MSYYAQFPPCYTYLLLDFPVKNIANKRKGHVNNLNSFMTPDVVDLVRPKIKADLALGTEPRKSFVIKAAIATHVSFFSNFGFLFFFGFLEAISILPSRLEFD